MEAIYLSLRAQVATYLSRGGFRCEVSPRQPLSYSGMVLCINGPKLLKIVISKWHLTLPFTIKIAEWALGRNERLGSGNLWLPIGIRSKPIKDSEDSETSTVL